jgi:acid phosphatase type 7
MRAPRRWIALLVASSMLGVVFACSDVLKPDENGNVDPAGAVTLIGAGDIANCGRSTDELTADLLDTIPGTIFAAGDNAYQDGTATEYATCYHPSWGRHKNRTRPVPGNHEYHTLGASGYFDYFNGVGNNNGPAGERGHGYYSYDLGAWHVVALNSEVGVNASSEQIAWLKADLAASTRQCTLAYWHRPRFSSSRHGSSTSMQYLWQALYEAGAEIVVVGHDHVYERFAPQTATGVADPERGIRQFVVGTGGAGLYAFNTPIPNSEVRDNTAYGVIKFTLSPGAYAWRFIPVAGSTFTDSGSGTCH